MFQIGLLKSLEKKGKTLKKQGNPHREEKEFKKKLGTALNSHFLLFLLFLLIFPVLSAQGSVLAKRVVAQRAIFGFKGKGVLELDAHKRHKEFQNKE